MDGLSFVASLVRSLAWPGAVVIAVVVLRRPLVGWLAMPPRRLKVGPGGVEAEWSEQTARVVGSLTPKPGGAGAVPEPGEAAPEASDFAREMLALVDAASPIAAVEAHARGLVNTANLDAVEGLGVMHTMAVLDTNRERLEPAKAREYVALAEAVLYALRTQPRP